MTKLEEKELIYPAADMRVQLSIIAEGIIDGENYLRDMADASKAGFSSLEIGKSRVTFKKIFLNTRNLDNSAIH